MLVDRVLADLDLPQPSGQCLKCSARARCRGMCAKHYDQDRYQRNRAFMLTRETARSKTRYWTDPEAGRALSRAKQRRRRSLDPDLSSRERREWYSGNPTRAREVSRVNMRLYRERHPERAEEATRRWMEAHPDAVRDMRHRAYLKRYAANTRRYSAMCAKRRALKKAATVGPVDYDAVLIRDAGRCGICCEPVAPHHLHYDHIVPLSRGGAHSTDNLQVSHARCNLRKGARCS